FLVVQDIFMTETAKMADVILPAACFAEKDGVFTNSDRRVQRVRKAVQPPGQARADWEIVCDLARAVGYDMPHYTGPDEVYAELAALSPQFSGISHERIDREGGRQWPCLPRQHPGTPTSHEGGPPLGRAPCQPIAYRPSNGLADVDYPWVLSTGRTLYHYNAAPQTRRDPGPATKQPSNFIEIHKRDAKRLGVWPGDEVRVISRRGEVLA